MTTHSPDSPGELGLDPEHDLAFSFLSTGLMEDTRHIERTARRSDMVLAAVVA